MRVEGITVRSPAVQDGMAVFRLIKSCPPLDINSSYCNFLQCSHFAGTSVVAELNGELVGFISGYITPKCSRTLFVWQVAIDEKARGRGLASYMLGEILARPDCEGVDYMETTITEGNKASWALFKGLARNLSADFCAAEWLDSKIHFEGQHDSEALVRIGPFKSIKRTL